MFHTGYVHRKDLQYEEKIWHFNLIYFCSTFYFLKPFFFLNLLLGKFKLLLLAYRAFYHKVTPLLTGNIVI